MTTDDHHQGWEHLRKQYARLGIDINRINPEWREPVRDALATTIVLGNVREPGTLETAEMAWLHRWR